MTTLSDSALVGGFSSRLQARFSAHCYPAGVLSKGVGP
jgi:hypothetical protein